MQPPREDQPLPGSILKNDRLQNKRLLLLYEGVHIQEKEYTSHIEGNILGRYCKGNVDKLYVHHKIGSDNVEKLTCIILVVSEPITTRSAGVLRWLEVQPIIRGLTREYDLVQAIRYIESLQCETVASTEKIDSVSPIKEKLNIPVQVGITQPLLPWQRDVLVLMNKNIEINSPSNRSYLVHSTSDRVGITFFLDTLARNYPETFLIFKDVPDIEMFKKMLEVMRRSGRNTDSIIFDLTHQGSKKNISELPAEARDQGCKNVWIFVDSAPNIEDIEADHWILYQISKKRSNGEISNLQATHSSTIQSRHRFEYRS